MPDFDESQSCWKWQKWLSSYCSCFVNKWLSWNYYIQLLTRLSQWISWMYMKWLWVWIVNFDSENDRNTKQEKSDIEWTWVCWFGSNQCSNILCSSNYVGSKGSVSFELSCILWKKLGLIIMISINSSLIIVFWYHFFTD